MKHSKPTSAQTRYITVFAIASLTFASVSHAATIYSDSLLGSSTALSATTVDTSSAYAGGTVGATWTANSVNETASGANFGSTRNAYLPISITTGYVYTLTATLATTKGNSTDGWTALGFTNGATNTTWSSGSVQKNAWALVRYSGGGTPQFFGGLNTANGQTWASTDNGTQTVTITLDTTSALWKTYATINGVNSNTFTYSANPTITHVGFGNYTNNATNFSSTVSNFSLAAIPEPHAALIGGLGMLALLRRRR